MSHDQYRPSSHGLGWVMKWIIAGAIIVALVLLVSYLLGWVAKPLEMTSPDNMEMLSRQANDSWQALEAKQSSVQAVNSKSKDMLLVYGEDQEKWPQGKRDEYLQLRAQVTNLVLSYNAQCGEYNAFWKDEWRSLPAPKDIPTSCEMMSE